MRKIIRSLSVGFLAFVGAVILGISWTMTTAIQLQATTALIMGGTWNPDPNAAYVADVSQRYINPFADLPYDPPPLAVHTPEQFFPVFGTLTFDDSVAEGVVDLQDAVDANTPNADDRVIICGYSQSGRIATIAKRKFIEDYDPADPEATPIAGFVLLANPNKPDGGILERYKFIRKIPFLGIPSTALPRPTARRILTAATSRRPRTSPSSTTVSPTIPSGCSIPLRCSTLSPGICTCTAKAQRRMRT